MEYPIFFIHVELYIVGKLSYISQLLRRFYFNLSCTERVTLFDTPAAHGLEELFSDVLERFLEPIHAISNLDMRCLMFDS
jgi:hypothetical protein